MYMEINFKIPYHFKYLCIYCNNHDKNSVKTHLYNILLLIMPENNNFHLLF